MNHEVSNTALKTINTVMMWLFCLTVLMLIVPWQAVSTEFADRIESNKIFLYFALIIEVSNFISQAIFSMTTLLHKKNNAKRIQERVEKSVETLDFAERPKNKVIDLIAEGMDIHHLYTGPAERREKVQALMEQVGLNPSGIDRYPYEFSGGMRQRIGIARALAVEPRLLLCDEPISALDVSIQAQIVNLLLDLREQKSLTYLLISHDLSMVRHLSDRILVMYLGEVVEESTAQELYTPNP